MPVKERKKITIAEVEAIAKLANLNLTQQEKEIFPNQIESILDYVDKINEVDTSNVEFQSQVDLKNVFRHDVAKPSLSQEMAISNRKKKSKDGYYVISTVISK
jgi:aspartyl-tRNA(Asn)/glutamyl-tRNA(Gln) amidotransferase subunit C